MGKIHILDEHIANQIAAGEVVERPASVVKELVENSIDAGSTRIDVAVEEGGLQTIRVTDNGTGMGGEDCQTAFLRHATSKIESGKDLFRIRTLGFRGEALPSIAAVSRLECTTSPDNSGLGSRITVEAGGAPRLDEAAAAQGTDIVVRDLFYNTPARLKYMKTIQTELSHISDYVYRLALAHPRIAFTLKHNGGMMLQTLGDGELLQVIAAIYGTSTAKLMLPFEASNADYTVKGYAARPEITRANRGGISTMVNGRYIRNYPLIRALMNGYHTLLPIHRFPVMALDLRMDPSLVDVNVHPAKLEVRFSKEAELLQFIEQEIKLLFRRQVLIPQMDKSEQRKPSVIQEEMALYSPRRDNAYPGEGAPARTASAGPPAGLSQGPAVFPPGRTSNPMPAGEYLAQAAPSGSQTLSPPTAPAFPALFPIGQMHGTYIIAQNDNGLYLIDQHAAHERINYEYYYEQFGKPQEASQELLVPITLEYTAVEKDILMDRLHLLEQAGVILEHFGGNSFIARALPHWFPEGEEKRIVQEMVEWVIAEKKAVDLSRLREAASTMCSCKASIKANQSLSPAEIEALLERLGHCRNPYTCPHGRPIVISFSTYELEKMFKRVM